MTSDEVMGGSTTFTMLSTTTHFTNRIRRPYKAVYQALEEAIQMIEIGQENGRRYFAGLRERRRFLAG